ncbi:HAD family hydrolase [Clostridium sp. MSJ-4]|uniref:HAD family hydrolase n=1 Tax=Clostridium simiarum TaxID=2841506 RepID=A0ABS6EY08_9CLOT|nr:HAD family hydrolase [Clostridium simiarum]MBU5590242.1 HAD family hydrolase [Clostridium simiarum]
MIKLIVTDMDGTFLNKEGKIDEDFYQLIEELNRRGIVFAVASGRLYSTLDKGFHKVKNKMIFMCNNGAAIQFNHNGELLYQCTLDKNEVLDIVEDLDEEGVEIIISDKDKVYIEEPSKELRELLVCGDAPSVELKSFKDLPNDIHKLSYAQHIGIQKDFANKIHGKYNEGYHVAVSGRIWMDIMNIEVSKGNAVTMIQKKLGIKEEETLIFGDYYNDISMFSKGYYSYAMKNAPEDVKKHARFVTSYDNNEGGVIKTIKELLNIK